MPRRTRRCVNCQDPGHRTPDCSLPRRDTRKCGGCGETGHMPRQCEKREDWVCKKCAGRGHGYWECTQAKRGPQPRCYLCNETGHRNDECTNTEKWQCKICNGTGHLSADCPRRRERTGLVCHACGENGHSVSQCSKATCFRCGAVGHIVTKCPTKRTRGPRPSRATDGASEQETNDSPSFSAPPPGPSKTSRTRPSRPKPEAPKPQPEPEPAPGEGTSPTTPLAPHDKGCRCMPCNSAKTRKSQEKPSAAKTVPTQPPEAASSEDNAQSRAHEATCTCSICKLVKRGNGKTHGPSNPSQKENVVPPHGHSSDQASGTRPKASSRHGPACNCATCAPPETHTRKPSAEYSPNSVAMGLWIRGTTALASGQTDAAIRLFSECITKDPTAAAFFRSRGDAYILRKDYAAALCDFQGAYERLKAAQSISAVAVLVRIARCRLSLGEHVPAMLAVREALSIDPGDVPALALKKRLAAIEGGVEAYQHAKARRQWKAARIAYEACAKAYAGDGGALPPAMRCWEAEVAVAEARWTEALAVSAKILGVHPRSIEALLARALVLFLTADLGEALSKVHAALKLDPDCAEAKAARLRYKSVMELKEDGNARFQGGDTNAAIEKWTSALVLVAGKDEEGYGGRIRTVLLLNRSKARLKLGQLPDALKDANAAEKLDPDNIKIIVTRGRIYVGLELFESAILEFKAALLADGAKLGAADRRIVQSELDEVEQRAARERVKLKDYYEILGLDRNCTTAEIRKAYRTQSLKHHPDKGGVAEKFRMVTEANNTLSDPVRRRTYDAKLPPKYGAHTQDAPSSTGEKAQSSAGPGNAGPHASPEAASGHPGDSPRQPGGTGHSNSSGKARDGTNGGGTKTSSSDDKCRPGTNGGGGSARPGAQQTHGSGCGGHSSHQQSSGGSDPRRSGNWGRTRDSGAYARSPPASGSKNTEAPRSGKRGTGASKAATGEEKTMGDGAQGTKQHSPPGTPSEPRDASEPEKSQQSQPAADPGSAAKPWWWPF